LRLLILKQAADNWVEEDRRMARRDEECNISIRNRGGVPIVEIAGELNRAALRAIESTIGSLAAAGHYHIVLNIRKALAANVRAIGQLQGAARRVLRHYGAIDVVAEAAQIRQLLSADKLARFFRFCTSENEALRRIKRLSRSPDSDEPECSAQIVEDR